MTDYTDLFFKSDWFRSRPKAVRETFRKYADQPISLEGFEEPHYLTGVTEDKETGRCGLWVSTIRLSQDYDEAMRTQFKVCPCCMKRVHIPTP